MMQVQVQVQVQEPRCFHARPMEQLSVSSGRANAGHRGSRPASCHSGLLLRRDSCHSGLLLRRACFRGVFRGSSLAQLLQLQSLLLLLGVLPLLWVKADTAGSEVPARGDSRSRFPTPHPHSHSHPHSRSHPHSHPNPHLSSLPASPQTWRLWEKAGGHIRRMTAGSQRFPAGSQRFPAGSQRLPAGSQRLPAGSQRLPAGSQRSPANLPTIFGTLRTRRKAQEAVPPAASTTTPTWESDWPACLSSQAVPAGIASAGPKFNYCTCAAGQFKNFSCPGVEAHLRGLLPRGRTPGGLGLLMLGLETEQLSKARFHLAESMLLARRMQRTLVLTNAQGSGIVMDRLLPLCSYFDTESIGQFVNWTAQQVLYEWMDTRKLSVVPLFLMSTDHPCNQSLLDHAPINYPGRQSALFRAINASLGGGQALCLAHSGGAAAASASLAEALRDPRHRFLHDADVIVVWKTAVNLFFPRHEVEKSLRHVSYAPHLLGLAQEMAQGQLVQPHPIPAPQAIQAPPPPYVGVHWRVEQTLIMHRIRSPGTSLDELLRQCAEGIVGAAREQLKALKGAVVFLASDIDFDPASGQPIFGSHSYHSHPQEKQASATKAIRFVHEELQPITWRHVEPLFPFLDSGVQGILDKLLCIGATHFLFAPPNCGGGWSSFTVEIKEERERRNKTLASSPWPDPVL